MATTKPRRRAVPTAGPDGRMSLVDHFIELRTRVVRSAVAIVIGMIVGFFIWHPVLDILKAPYCDLPLAKRHPYGGVTKCELNYTHPLDGFGIKLKVSAIVGVLLAAPVWLYQLWAVSTAGLSRNERRCALSFVSACVVLYSGGVVAAYLTLSASLEFSARAAGSCTAAILDI